MEIKTTDEIIEKHPQNLYCNERTIYCLKKWIALDDLKKEYEEAIKTGEIPNLEEALWLRKKLCWR